MTKPKKEKHKYLAAMVPVSLFEKIEKAAAVSDRSISAEVRVLLQEGLDSRTCARAMYVTYNAGEPEPLPAIGEGRVAGNTPGTISELCGQPPESFSEFLDAQDTSGGPEAHAEKGGAE